MRTQRPGVSIVICARNEEARIEKALIAARRLGAEEIIVVDGASSDRTAEIAARHATRVLTTTGGLARDRQIGIDAAQSEYVAMIDADHRPRPGDLEALFADMDEFGLDFVQAGVTIEETGFWTRAENEALATFHHQAGPRSMIGTAPALYSKKIFEKVRFDETNTKQNDDADFCYRLSQHPEFKFGIGRTQIAQEHHASFSEYWRKFSWYGRRDAEFCLKHPNRAHRMAFHLMVRYPILRPAKALAMGRWRAAAFFWVCAAARARACAGRLFGVAKAAFAVRSQAKGAAT